MSHRIPPTIGRRRFLEIGGMLGLSFGSLGRIVDPTSTRVTDRGDAIGWPTRVVDGLRGNSSPPPAPEISSETAGRPPGTIESTDFEWITPGAPATGNRFALRVVDRGGVDVGFRIETLGSLTLETHLRHHHGRRIAYVFNDAGSIRRGFRAFTNGIAGDGIYVRNVFGGGDIATERGIQDGEWHSIRIILDAEANLLVGYLDGERFGQSFYHGEGWAAGERFRVMGRMSGNPTMMDYDRFVIADRAFYPDETPTFSGDPVHYELEDGSGRTLENRTEARMDSLIEDKRTLIDRIRDAGDTVLPTDRARELDRAAETVLEGLESNGPPGAEDTLDRLIDAERVTHSATAGGIEPAGRTADTVVALTQSIAMGRLAARSLGVAGWAARRLRSMLRDLTARARRVRDALLARPVLAPGHREHVDGLLEAVTQGTEEFVAEHEEELVDVGESLLSVPIEAAIERLPDAARAELETLRSRSTAGLTGPIYDRYQFAPATGQPAGGINRAIEAAVAPIVTAVGAGTTPPFRDGSDLDRVRDEAIEAIERIEELVLDAIDAMESVAGPVGTFGLVVTIMGLGSLLIAAVATASGVGIPIGVSAAVIGTKLQLYGVALGGIAGLLTAGSTIVGIGSLHRMRALHEDAIGAILATEGGQ